MSSNNVTTFHNLYELRKSVGQPTQPVIEENVELSVILVTEKEIISVMILIWERIKIVVEPSGAIVLAAVLTQKFRTNCKKLKKFHGTIIQTYLGNHFGDSSVENVLMTIKVARVVNLKLVFND